MRNTLNEYAYVFSFGRGQHQPPVPEWNLAIIVLAKDIVLAPTEAHSAAAVGCDESTEIGSQRTDCGADLRQR